MRDIPAGMRKWVTHTVDERGDGVRLLEEEAACGRRWRPARGRCQAGEEVDSVEDMITR